MDVDMGAIVANSRVALWLMRLTGYSPVAGEALPLMSHNGLGLASCVAFLVTAREALGAATVALALTLVAFEGDLSPFSTTALGALPPSTLAVYQKRCSEAVLILVGKSGEEAGERQGGRLLQDPLSIRCGAVVHAAAAASLDLLEEALWHGLNTPAPNPLVVRAPTTTSTTTTTTTARGGANRQAIGDSRQSPLVTNSNFDPTPLRLALDHARLAMGEVATRSHARLLATSDPGQSGLPAFKLGESGGAHNRNVVLIAAAAAATSVRDARAMPTWPCRVADGVEDATSGLSSSLIDGHRGLQSHSTVLSCEFLVAWEALAHRQKTTLQAAVEAVPRPLRGVLRGMEAVMVGYEREDEAFDLGGFRKGFTQVAVAAVAAGARVPARL